MPFPPPGDLPDPGREPAFSVSLTLQVDSLLLEPSGKPMLVGQKAKNKILDVGKLDWQRTYYILEWRGS